MTSEGQTTLLGSNVTCSTWVDYYGNDGRQVLWSLSSFVGDVDVTDLSRECKAPMLI